MKNAKKNRRTKKEIELWNQLTHAEKVKFVKDEFMEHLKKRDWDYCDEWMEKYKKMCGIK